MTSAQALLISRTQGGKSGVLVSIILAAITNNPLDFSDSLFFNRCPAWLQLSSIWWFIHRLVSFVPQLFYGAQNYLLPPGKWKEMGCEKIHQLLLKHGPKVTYKVPFCPYLLHGHPGWKGHWNAFPSWAAPLRHNYLKRVWMTMDLNLNLHQSPPNSQPQGKQKEEAMEPCFIHLTKSSAGKSS